MCVGCSAAFRSALQSRAWPSRRRFLSGFGALSAGAWIAEAAPPFEAHAVGSINDRLTRALADEAPAEAAAPVTIFIAKKIITMERRAPTATAVAVVGKRILALGSLAQVRSAIGARLHHVNDAFADKVVLPGLIDQHLHPILGALALAVEVIAPEDWYLPGRTHEAAKGPNQYRERLASAAAQLRDPHDWLLTWGYHALWHGPIDRALLDSIGGSRPIAIWQRSCHEFYLNSAALDALGLTEAMTRGKGLASEQVNWGEGHFWESGLNLVAGPLLKVLATPERLTFGLKQMVSYLHANGVTAFNEPGALFTPEIWKFYEQILGAPDTPLYSTFLADGRGIPDRVGLDRALDATEQQIAVAPDAPGRKLMFLPKQVKLFADGAVISLLMQMKDGYADGHNGEWIIPPNEFGRRFKLYWDAGYQIHIHVNGDLALDVVLDALERSMRERPRADHRTVIVHFAISNEAQVKRIRRLGAIVSANPYYPAAFADTFGKAGLGRARADAMVRARSVLQNRVSLSYHSDLPMAPSDPLYLAWCGVNRLTPSHRVAGPEQRISVEQALRAVTIDAAYSWRREDWIGSIAPGKIANFTVLEQDPYAVPPARLKDIPVWGTVFEGRVFPVPEAMRRPLWAR
jgi:predicted amidohydrolase YtcJ